MPERDESVEQEAPAQAPRTVNRADSAASRLRPSRRAGRPANAAKAPPAAPETPSSPDPEIAAPGVEDAEPAAVEAIEDAEPAAVEPAREDDLPTPAEPIEEPGAAPAEPFVKPAEPIIPAAEPAAPERSTPREPSTRTGSIAAARAEAAPAEVVVGERTGRIEIPVPSVVRARERAARAAQNPVILSTESLTKSYGNVIAAGDIDLVVREGSFTGVVGPNGAGKTTTLSMITGLLRPTSGRVTVHGIDVWEDGPAAKRILGVLPDRLRLFDRLTGAQLLFYSGILQGLEESVVNERARELAAAFGLESALGRLVSDYSAGMQKKIALACSMIHAPKVLVLDEPFEAIDPVSAANVTEILEKFVAGGGSVIMSSHSLDLIQRICDHVAVIIDGEMIAQGTVDEVRDGVSLEERFIDLIQRSQDEGGMEWLHRSSDSD